MMKTDNLMKKKQVELNKTEFEYPNMTWLMSFSSVSGFHDHESGQDSNEQKEIEEFKSNNPTQKNFFDGDLEETNQVSYSAEQRK